ncbi:alpha/beta hydrolase [Candidatus Microgenomates bacterium]|nr:MAG: alpha/beta hydrolase [Candidatus Microgenomates bacterium]
MKVVVLHGWGHNKQIWEQFVSKFPDAIALDMPGFGAEKLVPDSWGVSEYANWVEKRISKYINVILIGHSFGGRVAAEISAKSPKYLKGLVLTGAPCVYRPSLKTKLKIKFYKVFKVFLPNSVRRLFYSGDLKTAGELEQIFRKVVVYDQSGQLAKIKINTLLLWGEKDDQVPVNIARKMHRLIDNSELKTIENAGHNVFLDKPDLFYGYIKKFISNL